MKCGNKPNCKNKFSEIKFFSGIKYFCSEECKEAFIQGKFSEEKNFSEKKVSPIKKISDKKKKRLLETGGEKETFKKVNLLDKHCWICKKYIYSPQSFTFPHLLAKSKFPALRNFTENIGRCCSIEHHQELDLKITKLKKDQKYLNALKKYILEGRRNQIYNLVTSF